MPRASELEESRKTPVPCSRAETLPIDPAVGLLQHQREASEQASSDDKETVCLAEREHLACGIGLAAARRTVAETRKYPIGAAGSGADCGRGGLARLVLELRVESTARVVLPTRGSTGAIATAARHALVAPFLADEVRECKRVFGDIGLLAVATEAAVFERFRIAGI